MKRTVLSEKEGKLLSELMAKFGEIVTFEEIFSLLKETQTRQVTRNLVHKLQNNGWLIRIKKGVYFISELNTLGYLTLNPYKTAQIISKDSYVSFENALQYHKMFNQLLKSFSSVSLKQYRDKTIDNTTFIFKKTKPDKFYGWQEEKVDNYSVKIATPEKAMIDILNFNRNLYSIDLVIEIFKEYLDEINLKRLVDFSERNNFVIVRIFGFLLDLIDEKSDDFYRLIKDRDDISRMTSAADLFSSQWRLYYNKELKRYEG